MHAHHIHTRKLQHMVQHVCMSQNQNYKFSSTGKLLQSQLPHLHDTAHMSQQAQPEVAGVASYPK